MNNIIYFVNKSPETFAIGQSDHTIYIYVCIVQPQVHSPGKMPSNAQQYKNAVHCSILC